MPHHWSDNRNRNRKLLISRAPTKAKPQEPAYSQALNQNKIDRQRSISRESVRQTVRRLWWMVPYHSTIEPEIVVSPGVLRRSERLLNKPKVDYRPVAHQTRWPMSTLQIC